MLEKYFISFIQRMEIFHFLREDFTWDKLKDRENKKKIPVILAKILINSKKFL